MPINFVSYHFFKLLNFNDGDGGDEKRLVGQRRAPPLAKTYLNTNMQNKLTRRTLSHSLKISSETKEARSHLQRASRVTSRRQLQSRRRFGGNRALLPNVLIKSRFTRLSRPKGPSCKFMLGVARTLHRDFGLRGIVGMNAVARRITRIAAARRTRPLSDLQPCSLLIVHCLRVIRLA